MFLTHAELHSQRVRDVITTALLAYLDRTRPEPLETVIVHVLRQAESNINEATSVLHDLLAQYRDKKGMRHDEHGPV